MSGNGIHANRRYDSSEYKPLGLACPKCGGEHFKTLETRKCRHYVVSRRKKCTGCGHVFTTSECIDDAAMRHEL